MDNLHHRPASATFHHHWLAFWRRLIGTVLLAVVGSVGLSLGLPWLGLTFYTFALMAGLATYCSWTWHTLTFTPDNRLVYRHGFLGTSRRVISLFGTITATQIPVLGNRLDVGSLHLSIPGADMNIRHIARFSDFYQRFLHTRQQQGGSPNLSVYVNLIFVPGPTARHGGPGQLPSPESIRFPVYPSVVVREGSDQDPSLILTRRPSSGR